MKERLVYIILISLTIIFLFSCQSKSRLNPSLKEALSNAGNNRFELIKIIEHYSESKSDSLKLKAAIFLIENMDGLYTLDTTTVAKNTIYFDLLNRLWNVKHKKLEEFQIAQAIDSLNHSLNLKPQIPKDKYLSELGYVSSELIINNVDEAFEIWRTRKYSRRINFREFCEFILPYRCSNTYSQNSREYFFNKYKSLIDSVKNKDDSFEVSNLILKDIDKDFKEAFVTVSTKYPYLKPLTFSNLMKGKLGDCHDINSVRVTALRAQGVPVALESIPGWGNSNAKHYWSKILDKRFDKSFSISENKQIPYVNQSDIIGKFWKDEYVSKDIGIPRNINVNYCKTIPKVFRECYSKQSNSLAALPSLKEAVPSFFSNDRLLDVTEDYIKCSNLTIHLNGLFKRQIGYLCCFNNIDLTPVAWGKIINGKIFFENVGINIVYFPAYYKGGNLIPAANPFILNKDGKITELAPSNSCRKKVTFILKSPYRSNVMFHGTSMIGGRFQGANKSDLSDTSTIYKIKSTPFYDCEVKLKPKSKYRYLIYQFKGLPRGHVAEIQFWGLDKNLKEVKIDGVHIGNQGRYGTEITNAFDGKLLSYFVPEEHDRSYIGIDLGPNNAMKVTKIKYCPRNDNNAIEAGRSYELFYWKGGWISLGSKKAVISKFLQFNNVPAHALLLLKDATGGNENRIFTYENEKQVFW